MKKKLAEALRRLADVISPETAWAASSSRFYFVARRGLVTKTDGGIQVKPKPRGVRLWYRRCDYDQAFTPSGDYFPSDKESDIEDPHAPISGLS